MNTPEELTGTIDRFVFQNAENGFAIFILETSTKEKITIKGSVPDLQPGQHVTLHGSWLFHAKFGKQFDAKKCVATMPTSLVGLEKYLGSGLISGIGPTYAKKLVDRFGTSVLEVIDKQPHRLSSVDGIGAKRLEQIITAWKSQKEIATVMVFLQDKGISTTYATKIYKKYGQESIALIQENPYRLSDDFWGIGFKTADQIAQNLGFAKQSVKRICAGITHELVQATNNGHLYVELNELKNKTIELLELTDVADDVQPAIKTALHELHEKDSIKLITFQEQHFVARAQYYHAEKGAATKLLQLLETPTFFSFDLQKIYQQLRAPQEEHDIALNEDQQHAIMTCLKHKVAVITGGPGTGKTTLIKKLLRILEQEQISYRLAAPTGRAAKRIMEGTHRHAETIHRLLEFDFTTMGFTRNESNAIKTQFLIIDEASMIDIFLAQAILKAMPQHSHILFIGDIHQLPSVGAGNFLHDIIASNKIPCVKLEQIFRQAHDSMIVVNAHRINKGEFPTSTIEGAKRDFVFIKEDLPENIPTHLETIIKRGLPKYHISTDDMVVLVPMHRGPAGTQKINFDLQNMLNGSTSKPHITQGGNTFKVGDRVMQLRNNYDKKVFNGDIGKIESVELEDKKITVQYPERVVEYDFGELNELVLAYAISIHKSQGSEFAAVVVCIFMSHFTLLQRNLIYTAITRAKKLCVFVGQSRAIAMAINNNKGTQRTTFLTQYLTSNLACR